ncbi:MAG: PilX N-terminal domain-containing pilus assembly protein [Candidatus Omnitrophota bacterium]
MCRNQSKKGMVLLLTSLMVMMVLSLLGVSMLAKLTMGSRSVGREMYAKKAFYLAEAGIESAVWRLDNDGDSDWSNGTPADFSGSLGSGSFNVIFSSKAKDSIQIESTGIVPTNSGGNITRIIKTKITR